MPEEEDSEVLSEFDIRNKDVWKMPICEDSRILIKYMDGPQPGNTERKPAVTGIMIYPIQVYTW